jgi:2-iminobutanoate/2-iminopropanoate deaminase
VSGQGGLRDGVKVEGGVRAETTQTMQNVAAQLATVGASLSDVVKTTCFLTDMDNFAAFNEAYAEAFGSHRPARSTVGVAQLPGNFLVEVEAWAYVAQG